jgi:hypothetical protein
MTQGLVLGLIEPNGRVKAGDDVLDELDAVADTVLLRCERNDRSLRALDISNSLLTSRFFTYLSDALLHNSALQELYLDHCKISDEAVRVLSKGLRGRQGLKALSLQDNEVRCLGASHLARLLGCAGSRWTRSFGGYRALSYGPGVGLEYLALTGNSIASGGAKALSEALMGYDDTLQTLSLDRNRIDDWGAGWFAMVVRNNNVLRCLNLNDNPVGPDGIDELCSACQTTGASLVLLPAGALDSSGVSTNYVGERMCTVIVSSPEADEEAKCRSVVHEQDAYRRHAVGQRPLAICKQNYKLNILEPACIMADSQAAQSALKEPVDGKQHKKSERPVSASTYLMSSAPLENELVVAPNASAHPQHAPPVSKFGERRSFLEEKEVATTLVPSRWKWKTRGPIGPRLHDSTYPAQGPASRCLRRSQSAPRKRVGMLMGVQAASAL